MVPAREVGRAVRAHQLRAAARRRRLRRRGADVPRAAGTPGEQRRPRCSTWRWSRPTRRSGPGRLICVDGPAGSGKTTLAEELASLSGAPVIHMDDLFEGWDGLPRISDQLDTLLPPLAEGRPGSYRRWDWPGDAWAETVLVPPAPLLVLEGVGSGALAHRRADHGAGLGGGALRPAHGARPRARRRRRRRELAAVGGRRAGALRPRAHPRAGRRRPRRPGRLARRLTSAGCPWAVGGRWQGRRHGPSYLVRDPRRPRPGRHPGASTSTGWGGPPSSTCRVRW